MKAAARILLAAAAALAAAPATAQVDEDQRWIATVGGGALFSADFPGARSHSAGVWPIFGLRRADADEPLFVVDEGGGFPILRAGRFVLGPSINVQGSRRDADVGLPLGDIERSWELGASVTYYASSNFRLRAEARHAVTGHGGLVGNLGADFVAQPTPRLRMSFGPRVRFGDDRFMQTYFGVTPAQAARTGLPFYEAGGGVRAVGGMIGARQLIGDGWSLHAFGRYDRLVGDAADSPVLQAVGTRDQWGGGLGLSYSFRVGRR